MFQKQEIPAGCLLFVSVLELIPRDQEVSWVLELVEKVVPTKFHIVQCPGDSLARPGDPLRVGRPVNSGTLDSSEPRPGSLNLHQSTAQSRSSMCTLICRCQEYKEKNCVLSKHIFINQK